MASTPGNQKATHLENSQGKKSQHAEEAIFYMNCRAAYLTVLKSSLENIKSKEQLSLALQQAGRNPSQKTINKYWTSQTTSLNFDDFCAILKKEKPATKNELLEAFGKIDTDKSGYILHDELFKILTTRGDKMTWEEVTSITKQADFNCSGKLDYSKFCELYLTTSEQCCKAARDRLETDPRLRQQHFGNQTEHFSHGITLPASKASPRVSRKTDHKLAKGDSRAPSRPSSAQSSKASTSTTVTVSASSSRNTKLIIEPDTMKEWQCAQSKGCFYLEEDGEIISHKYRLHLPQRSAVCVTIKPFTVPQAEEQVFGWRGELGAGVYWLLPFTTGCRLRKVKTQITGEAELVWRDEDGELALTREFRATLLDIFETIDLDGNGLLSLEEYNFFELRTSGEKCDQEAWAVCKENFEMKKNELTRQGFLDLNLMEANDRDGDPWDLWVTLLSLGYNKALEMTEACPFVIDISAERCKPRIKAISLEAGGSQLSRAVCRSVVIKGEAKVLDGSENIFIYTYRSGSRITSVIENKSENKVIIHVNNEQSKNCLNSRGLTVFAVEVAPKSMMVSQHVMALNEQEEWIYSCVHSLVC
ncbi:PREDICTED: EF-hand calcium-binding domain-containing protein 7 isoform X2 [Pseudopodoces humilis]|uniref:EF-hand calcium-binding domain-containing protein 7 isoform X2 n=1 Tax=Pseudopodoces humilis TaxID=181119 RepID=UPI0006B754ED|nr:PREDICTED: EF-hand calcium-binding domain-containing protein 7 isoform X2 [Pseudopodoces humilis]